MSNLNQDHNRAVWVDVPVADLERASAFYAAVLDIEVTTESHDGYTFAVLEHEHGNGACLVPSAEEIGRDQGLLVYWNTSGRLRDAVKKVGANGGEVIQDVHDIGPHGFRALVRDSEGNKIALHSFDDA